MSSTLIDDHIIIHNDVNCYLLDILEAEMIQQMYINILIDMLYVKILYRILFYPIVYQQQAVTMRIEKWYFIADLNLTIKEAGRSFHIPNNYDVLTNFDL
jgi:hypothetical protein